MECKKIFILEEPDGIIQRVFTSMENLTEYAEKKGWDELDYFVFTLNEGDRIDIKL